MQRPPLLLATAGAAIVAAIITGILVVGGPGEARRERLDKARASDLADLSRRIVKYSRTHAGRFPETLDELGPDTRVQRRKRDPETGAPYEYAIIGERDFELCAVFTTEGPHAFTTNVGDFMAGATVKQPSIVGAGRGCLSAQINQ